MSYSFYEIYITAQRAFTAMGFPYGSDEDAAFIIAWLELNNFQGISLLSNLINQLDQKYEGKIKLENLNQTIDFKNKSILMKGAGLIDFITSEMKYNNKISVKIINCSNEIFFLPLLYRATKYIKSSKLIFYDKNYNINTYIIMDYKIIFYQEKNKNLKFKNIVNIVMNKNKENFQYPAIKELISEKEIQKNLSKSLSPAQSSWDIISKIANKTFVPESDESRNKGAGGGDDND